MLREPDYETEQLETYLFNPAFYVPFCHADCLSITLMDGFEGVHRLTACAETTVEEVSLAFCPKVHPEGKFLGVNDPDKVFRNPHTLLGTRDRDSFDQHPFQVEAPLLVFTRYKLDALGSVGYALLFQEMLLRAMARRILAARAHLLAEVKSSEAASALMSEEDIRSTHCAFLDLQGPEELGTLLFCNNYSVAVSFVSALRSLTYDDVLHKDADIDGRLARTLNGSHTHAEVLDLYETLSGHKLPGPDVSTRLHDMHVFRWTQSLLAVAPATYFGSPSCSDKSWVEALVHVQLSPGHQAAVEKALATAPAEPPRPAAPEEYHRYGVGRADLAMPQIHTGQKGRLPILPLRTALEMACELRRTFGCGLDMEEHGRHVIDTVTAMTIPLPVMSSPELETFFYGRVGGDHRPVLADILSRLRKQLHPEKGSPKPSADWLSPDGLQSKLQRCGIPVDLCRTIEFLYQNYRVLIVDPFLFDSVLDLNDTFAAFHALLTRHLPTARAGELRYSSTGYLPLLDTHRVRRISRLVDALHNALMHRVAGAYPELPPTRDMGIDFLGGLSQVLLAANAPLACGLGLLRKYVMAEDPSRAPRDTVGGLIRVSFTPGTRAAWLRFGTENEVQLACIEADVTQILQPASYCNYLHECGHLIFRNLLSCDRMGRILKHGVSEVMRDRMNEIFTYLLVHALVFGKDTDAFVAHHLISHGKSQASLLADDAESVASYSELILRLFVASYAIPVEQPRDRWETVATLGKRWYRAGLEREKVLSDFKAFLGEAISFLPDYERLWMNEKGDARQFCINHFVSLYPQIERHMPSIWQHVSTILSKHFHRDLHLIPGANDPVAALHPAVREAFQRGSPLVRCLYEGNPNATDTDSRAMDSMGLVCAMLYKYLAPLRRTQGRELHLVREPESGKVKYEGRKRRWNTFQIDRGSAELFCPVPFARGERLRRDIVVLKTFWDIAANLRARRLHEFVSALRSSTAPPDA